MANPPADPVRPSLLAGYSGTPLPKKLGIKPDSVVWLASAPPDFAATLGELPQGAVLRHDSRGRSNLIVWFTRSRAELERSLARMAAKAGQGPIWIAWPKKTSGVASDLSEQCVRDAGLAHGLVDYKVCAIDPTWSGLLFTKRKTPAK
ncbi:MAG: DUF3052 family protein [Acidobacteria bacterium]|nr:DUF3052 family protein [Acidobacteriota bacterium]